MSAELIEEPEKPTLADLRTPFRSEVYGKIPKGRLQLDYVGHAAVTDRLLSVDPYWTWEPFATDDRGLPAYDSQGNLWIRLSVLGVTRIGIGDGPDPKQRISDALRNAAMRFGVALELWSKDELESALEHPVAEGFGKPTAPVSSIRRAAPPARPASIAPAVAPSVFQDSDERNSNPVLRTSAAEPDPNQASTKQLNMIRAVLAKQHQITEDDAVHDACAVFLDRPITSLKELTKADASLVIDRLTAT